MITKKKLQSDAPQNAEEETSYYWGMDTFTFPGDDPMQEWFQNSPFSYTGYYLAPAPDRTDDSWMGHRDTLANQGWGVIPIYVGRAYGWSNLTSSQGAADAQAAVSLAQSENFPSSSYIYLDVEGGNTSTALLNYIEGWVKEVSTNTSYWPGIYCSSSPAPSIINVTAGYDTRYWIAHYTINPNPSNPAPDPAGCGISDATTWQCAKGKNFTFGSYTNRNIDVNTSAFSDPSR